MCNLRNHLRVALGAALILIVAAWAAPAQAATACRTTEACVVATVLGSNDQVLFTRQLTLSELETKNDQSTHFLFRTQGGSPVRQFVPSPVGVPAVVQSLLKVPLVQVNEVDVRRPDGTDVVMQGSDVATPGTYENGNNPSFYSYGGNQLSFIRPLLVRDSTDWNDPRDAFSMSTGQAIEMTVHTHGRLLSPVLTATPRKGLAHGKPARLEVTGYQGAGPVGPVSYTWDFADGSGTGPDSDHARHSWPQNGDYTVTVIVQQTDGNAAGVGQVDVRVGDPKGHGPGGGGGSSDPNAPSNGAEGGNGTHAGQDPNSPGGTGDRGNDTTPGTPGAAEHGDKPPASTSGVRVQGIVLDAAASPVTTQVQESAPLANAPSGAPKQLRLEHHWLWLLGLGPLLLLVAGAARQTRWLARRVPDLPWRRI